MKYLVYLLILVADKGFCDDSFYQDKTSGWFWYKDHNISKNKNLTKRPINPADQVDFEKEELDRVLKVAIKEPTDANLIQFIKLRNKLIDQSYNFGLRLRQVDLMNPTLDELKTYPVNQVSKEIYKTQKREHIEQKIARLTKTHGLFYVFASNCTYCHAFAPTVKNFAAKYGWSLIPISLDGAPIADFPDARQGFGLEKKLNITAIPALIMVEPKSGKVIPITTGVVSEEEIVERIDLLTRVIS